MINKGLIICAMGIPGSGKTAIFKELSHIIESSVIFCEPEENDLMTPWPKAVSQRNQYGYFGSLTWFRSMRVPLLFDAELSASKGYITLVDFYYDKLLTKYLGKEGLDWFFPRGDAYYSVAQQMAQLDYQYLPSADIVIFFKIKKGLWKRFCDTRGRNMDREHSFEEQCFLLQDPMQNACEIYGEDYKKNIIIFEVEKRTIEENATALYNIIKDVF